ncbi:MAG: hypothetical protein ACXVBX_09145 [Flavisolibacter sp.]
MSSFLIQSVSWTEKATTKHKLQMNATREKNRSVLKEFVVGSLWLVVDSFIVVVREGQTNIDS